MGAIDRALKRLGFVKLADYGLALSAEDRVVSLHDGKVVGRRAFDVDPPPLATIAFPSAPAPALPQVIAKKPAAQIVEDDDGDWEWQIAIARARAAAEEIERTVPSPPPVAAPIAAPSARPIVAPSARPIAAPSAPPLAAPRKSTTRPLATVAAPRPTDRMPAMAIEPESWETPPPSRVAAGTPPPPPRTPRAESPATIIPVPKLPRASTQAPVTPSRLARGTMTPLGESTRRYAAAPPANDDTRPDFRPSNRHLVARR